MLPDCHFLSLFSVSVTGGDVGAMTTSMCGFIKVTILRIAPSAKDSFISLWIHLLYITRCKNNIQNMLFVRHVTGNDKDYLRKIPRVVVQKSALSKGPQ
jgi:hypothetical protein